eukprot:g8464.t1
MMNRTVRLSPSIPVVLLGPLVLLAISEGRAADKPAANVPKIRISKETTFVKGPLRKDGHVDYPAALNQYARRGVTTENNAVVALARVFGPSIYPKSIRKEFFAELGIAVPPVDGRYFLTMSAFAKVAAGNNSKAYAQRLFDEQGTGSSRPWSRKELPKLAAWLEYNQRAIGQLHVAVSRKEFFHPLVTGSDDPESELLLAALMPFVQESRSFARALSARALLAVHEGRIDDARKDLLAGHRLARLIGKGQTLIEALVGMAIESMTCQTAVLMLQTGRLTDRQLQTYQQELAQLPPMSPIREKINIAERFMALDAACYASRQGQKSLRFIQQLSRNDIPAMIRDAEPTPVAFFPNRKVAAPKELTDFVDWSAVLKAINTEYDRMYADAGRKRFVDRLNAQKAHLEHLQSLKATVKKQLVQLSQTLRTTGKVDREAATKLLGNILIALLAPATSQATRAEDRSHSRLQLLGVAVALERYRVANGRFPDSLKSITPRFIKSIPADRYTEKPLTYRRTQSGYLLYCVGRNRKDDGGRTFGSQPAGDDIVVRVVMKLKNDPVVVKRVENSRADACPIMNRHEFALPVSAFASTCHHSKTHGESARVHATRNHAPLGDWTLTVRRLLLVGGRSRYHGVTSMKNHREKNHRDSIPPENPAAVWRMPMPVSTRRFFELTVYCAIAVAMVFAPRAAVAADKNPLGTVTEKHIWIPMRDGVKLSAYLFIPEGKGPWPVLMEQRYASFRGLGTRKRYAGLAEGGYVVAAVNFRGTQLSEGHYVGYRALAWGKQQDGYDAVEWLAKQKWSTGKVGTLGGSQGGFAQNFLAVTRPPSLVCQFMRDTGLSLFHEGYRIGGTTRPERFKGMARNCRVKEHNDLMLKEWFQHPHYDEYWAAEDCTRHFDKMNVPCFTLGSWYDFMNVGSVQSYIGRQHKGGPNSRGKQQLLIGPWRHGGAKGNVTGQMKYPKNAAIDLRKLQLRFFDYYLKGIKNGADKDPTIRYYVMGAVGENAPGNFWRTAKDWPIPIKPQAYYLRESGGLAVEPPDAATSSTSYLADPFKPARLPNRSFPGAADARPYEKQAGVKSFTTDVLTEPVEWTGLVKAELYVASSARDTDFIVRVCDVYPDGRSILIVSYVRRARYRDGFEKEKLLTPGKVTKVAFDVGWISQIFNKGHRIRVTVSSTGDPFYESNPNTGKPLTIEFPKDAVIAKNTIFHERDNQSRVIAPIPVR